MVSDVPTVVVAIITSGERPTLLARLIYSLEAQRGRDVDFQLAVALVDNGARATLVEDDFPRDLHVRVRHEPEPGIPIARNTSLVLARGYSPDYIAFIDDDERASSGWIWESLRCLESYGADAVAGRVEYEFARPLPSWQRLGGFYDNPEFPEGTSLPFARTTNLLISCRALEWLPERPFDQALRFSGGSDISFTRDLVAKGGKIVWSNRSLTIESVPATRCSKRWAFARAYRVGNNAGHAIYGSYRRFARFRTAISGLARIPYSALLASSGIIKRDPRVLGNALRIALRGAGIAASPFHRYEEYRR